MKKLRIFALAAMVFVLLAAFTGCNKLKAEDVESDPLKYLTEGMKLTFRSTPFSPMLEKQDKIAFEVDAKNDTYKAGFDVYLDAAEKKGAVKYSTSSDYGDGNEYGMDAELYYADGKLVINNGYLYDLFKTNAVGIDLFTKYKDFEKSALYDALVENEVITDENEKMLEKLMGKDGISKIISETFDSVQKLFSEQYKYDSVEEDTITVDGKEIKVIVVSASLNEDIFTDTVESVIDSVKDVAKLTDGDFSDEDAKELIDSVKKSLPKMKGEYKYYLSKETGALIKMESETESKVYDEYTEETTKSETSFEVTFGSDPTKIILPSFEYVTKIADDKKTTVEGETRIEDGKLIVEGMGTSKNGDEKNEVELLCTFGDGEFEITGDDGEEKYSIKGEFETSEKEIDVSIDLSDAYGEDEYDGIEKLSFTVIFGEDVPELPKYKDILDITSEDLENLFGISSPSISFSDYDTSFKTELSFYLDLYDEDLQEYLSHYEEKGFATEEEYLYYLFVTYTYEDLTTYYGAGRDVIDEFMNDIKNNGGTTYDLAVGLYDNYWDFAVPTEDEVRDLLDNYEEYEFSSVEEAIDYLTESYSEYLVIPEEYLD